MYWTRTRLVDTWIVKSIIFVVNKLLISCRKFNYYRLVHWIWLQITYANQTESDSQSVSIMVHIFNFIKRLAQVLQAKDKVHSFINLKKMQLVLLFQ